MTAPDPHAAAVQITAEALGRQVEDLIPTAVDILRAAADAIEDAPGWSDDEAARLREIALVMEEDASDEEQAIATAMVQAARGY